MISPNVLRKLPRPGSQWYDVNYNFDFIVTHVEINHNSPVDSYIEVAEPGADGDDPAVDYDIMNWVKDVDMDFLMPIEAFYEDD